MIVLFPWKFTISTKGIIMPIICISFVKSIYIMLPTVCYKYTAKHNYYYFSFAWIELVILYADLVILVSLYNNEFQNFWHFYLFCVWRGHACNFVYITALRKMGPNQNSAGQMLQFNAYQLRFLMKLFGLQMCVTWQLRYLQGT